MNERTEHLILLSYFFLEIQYTTNLTGQINLDTDNKILAFELLKEFFCRLLKTDTYWQTYVTHSTFGKHNFNNKVLLPSIGLLNFLKLP